MKARIAAVVTGISCCIAAVAWCGTNRTPRDTGFVRVRDSAGTHLPGALVFLFLNRKSTFDATKLFLIQVRVRVIIWIR